MNFESNLISSLILTLLIVSGASKGVAAESCSSLFESTARSFQDHILADLVRMKLAVESAHARGQRTVAQSLHVEFTRVFKQARLDGIDLTRFDERLAEARSHAGASPEDRAQRLKELEQERRDRHPWSQTLQQTRQGGPYDTLAIHPSRPELLQFSSRVNPNAPLVTEIGNLRSFFLDDSGITSFASLRQLQYNHDGSLIIGFSASRLKAWIWNGADGKLIAELPPHRLRISWISASADNTMVATSSHDGTTRLSDAQTGQTRHTLAGHDGLVNHHSFSGDSTLIATASDDKTARIFDTRSGKMTLKIPHSSEVKLAEFSADGQRLMTATADNHLYVWNSATGAKLFEQSVPDAQTLIARFSPDSSRIVFASRSSEQPPKLIDAKTGAVLFELLGHVSGVNAITFSPNGRLIATAGTDSTVRIWSASQGQELASLSGSDFLDVSFQNDGTTLFARDRSNEIRLWRQDQP